MKPTKEHITILTDIIDRLERICETDGIEFSAIEDATDKAVTVSVFQEGSNRTFEWSWKYVNMDASARKAHREKVERIKEEDRAGRERKFAEQRKDQDVAEARRLLARHGLEVKQ